MSRLHVFHFIPYNLISEVSTAKSLLLLLLRVSLFTGNPDAAVGCVPLEVRSLAACARLLFPGHSLPPLEPPWPPPGHPSVAQRPAQHPASPKRKNVRQRRTILLFATTVAHNNKILISQNCFFCTPNRADSDSTCACKPNIKATGDGFSTSTRT